MEPLSDDLTKDDFLQSGWEIVIAECDERECSAYSRRFGAKAREAGESGDIKSQQIFGLLRDMTSMYMKLDSPEEPFGPMAEFHDGRTAILSDFDESRVRLLSEVVANITDSELRARIADVLWLRKRDYRMGELAVSSYLESAKLLEDPKQWTETDDRIERALQLAVMLGKNASLYAAVIAHIEGVLSAYGDEDPLFLSAKMMRLLQERRTGDPVKYAGLAEKLASRAESDHDWHRAREYWEIKAQWHRMAKDDEQARAARVASAETHVKEAEDALQREPPSYLLASAFIQHAIEAFRRIENTKERVKELQATLIEYQNKSTSELVNISSSEDASDMVRMAVDHVKGKSLPDSLLRLGRLGGSPKVEELRKQVEEDRAKYVLQRLFPNVYLNAMGRVIARQPQNEEEAIEADMYRKAASLQSVHVQAFVEPARHQILSEHYVRLDDFAPFVSNNPFIPAGREQIIARGLYAGLHGDFLTAVHFLIPQLEESVRYVLYQLKVITSGLDDEGVQDEYNLNRLLSSSEYTVPLAESLGKDLVFDLRGLLVERFGSNLRNDMAHGLLTHNAFFSISGCYLWWLCLRLYSWPTIARLRQSQSDTDQTPP